MCNKLLNWTRIEICFSLESLLISAFLLERGDKDYLIKPSFGKGWFFFWFFFFKTCTC